MYAVIATGGKQQRVETGQVLQVELLGDPVESEISFEPVLVVDDGAVLATPEQLQGCSVTAQVLGERKGPKVRGFIYKNTTNYTRRWGHRQRYSEIEIIDIKLGKPAPSKAAAKKSAEN